MHKWRGRLCKLLLCKEAWFNELFNMVNSYLTKINMCMRKSISVEEKLAPMLRKEEIWRTNFWKYIHLICHGSWSSRPWFFKIFANNLILMSLYLFKSSIIELYRIYWVMKEAQVRTRWRRKFTKSKELLLGSKLSINNKYTCFKSVFEIWVYHISFCYW